MPMMSLNHWQAAGDCGKWADGAVLYRATRWQCVTQQYMSIILSYWSLNYGLGMSVCARVCEIEREVIAELYSIQLCQIPSYPQSLKRKLIQTPQSIMKTLLINNIKIQNQKFTHRHRQVSMLFCTLHLALCHPEGLYCQSNHLEKQELTYTLKLDYLHAVNGSVKYLSNCHLTFRQISFILFPVIEFKS